MFRSVGILESFILLIYIVFSREFIFTSIILSSLWQLLEFVEEAHQNKLSAAIFVSVLSFSIINHEKHKI
jgi:membrane protease YdiL (CAAX protease family)